MYIHAHTHTNVSWYLLADVLNFPPVINISLFPTSTVQKTNQGFYFCFTFVQFYPWSSAIGTPAVRGRLQCR